MSGAVKPDSPVFPRFIILIQLRPSADEIAREMIDSLRDPLERGTARIVLAARACSRTIILHYRIGDSLSIGAEKTKLTRHWNACS
jgi:hypothetical protein